MINFISNEGIFQISCKLITFIYWFYALQNCSKNAKSVNKMINFAWILENPFVRNDIYHYLYHIPSSNDQKLTIQGWPLKYAFKLILEKSERESKWHNLWSKWPISDLVFYNIKMPPCSCPLGSSLLLTGALKGGIVQTSTSTDSGIMKGQN